LLFDDFEGVNPLDNYTADIGNISDWEVVPFGPYGEALHYKGAIAWYLLSRKTVTFQNLRILCRIYPDVASPSNYYAGVVFRETATNTFYYVWLAKDSAGYAGSPSGSRIDWMKRVNGTDSYIAGSSTDYLSRVWSDVEVVIYGSSVKAYLNGVQKISATDTAISAAGKVGFIGLYQAYWDNFCVGKYVSPEPSHGSWGSEETAPVGVPRFIGDGLAGAVIIV
jgi:hypothetical protein